MTKPATPQPAKPARRTPPPPTQQPATPTDPVQRRQDELLDEAVEETFPASDPISPKQIT